MSLLDILTGGQSQNADEDLGAALNDISGVQAPTAAQLTLPQLQQYVDAGVMTPAQATAALQSSNAYNNINVDPATTEGEMTALSQLQNVAADNGMTPEMQAQLTGALNTSNTNQQGQEASIMDQMAQRGESNSLMGTAQEEAAAGQNAQNASLTSAQAAGQAEQNALSAMSGAGTLAGNINSQEYTQGANKAAAQNAIDQWNAENQTNVNLANTANQQAANLYNTETAQTVANTNTANANIRTEQNAQVPETVYNNAMQKANTEAGISEQQADQSTAQGNQNLGIYGAALNLFAPQPFMPTTAGTTLAGQSSSGGGGSAAPAGALSGLLGSGSAGGAAAGSAGGGAAAGEGIIALAAKGGYVKGGPKPQITRTPEGGVHVAPPYMADDGGQVPGKAQVQGDSLRNDRVKALLSPKEIVLPRTVTTAPNAPDRAKAFVQSLLRQPKPVKPMHPDDLHGLMQALSKRREAA
jgi:hypothetical protein